nr:hypothetical protein BaRGS_025837 [Batillaria attramentaria]
MADVDKYDPVTEEWEHLTDLHTARHNAGATVIDGKIYIVGGVSTNTNQVIRSVECYDTKSGKWDLTVPDLPRGAKSLSCVVIPQDILWGEAFCIRRYKIFRFRGEAFCIRRYKICRFRGEAFCIRWCKIYRFKTARPPASQPEPPSGDRPVFKFYTSNFDSDDVVGRVTVIEVNFVRGTGEVVQAGDEATPSGDILAIGGVRDKDDIDGMLQTLKAKIPILDKGQIMISGGYGEPVSDGAPCPVLMSTELFDPSTNQ